MSWLSKAWKKATKYASGLLKPIDDLLGTDFSKVDDRNAQIDENNSARAFEAHQAELQRNFNAYEAEKQRQWEAEQSNTAIQRRSADLQAAGINPILAAGSGAETGTGATATSGIAGAPTNALPATTARKMHRLEMKMADAEINKTEAETGKISAEAIKTLNENGYTTEKIKTEIEQRAYLIQLTKNAKTEKEKLKAEAELKKWESEHALLLQLLPGIVGIAGGVIGGALGNPLGGALGGMLGTSARKIGFKTN